MTATRGPKVIMDGDEEIKQAIANRCGDAIDADGNIDRKRLGAVVSADAILLEPPNSIVHGAKSALDFAGKGRVGRR